MARDGRRHEEDEEDEDVIRYNNDEEEEEEGDYSDTERIDEEEEEDLEDEEAGEEELRKSGFIVDDEENESEEDREDRERRREERKRRREERRRLRRENQEREREDEELDEDDLELVQENTGIRVMHGDKGGRRLLRRGKKKVESDNSEGEEENERKLKRKRVREEDEEEVEEDEEDGGGRMRRGARERRGSDDEEYGRGRGRGRREDLGLFDDEEEEEDDREDERRRRGREDARRQRGRRERREEGLEDFIEDESEGEEGGRERERERPKRGRADWGGFGDEIMEGLDEDTMYDLLEIFGDGTEYDFAMEERRPEDEVVEKEGILDRVFEPAEIEAKMLTTKDEEIRVTDCPERLQERGSGAQIYRRELSDEEIEEETTWILRQLNRKSEGEHYQGPSRAIMGHERFLAAVLSVLKLMSQEFMEVPFIYTHRKDLFETSESGDGEQVREWLTQRDLWMLYDMDTQFRGILAKRLELMAQVARVVNAGEWSGEDKEYLVQMLDVAIDTEELVDLEDWVQSTFRHVLEGNGGARQASMYKKPTQSQRAKGVENSKIRGFVKDEMGITAREFGYNLQGLGRHFVDDSEVQLVPEERIAQFVEQNPELGSDKIVMQQIEESFARTLAMEPNVRKYVRTKLSREGHIRVRPTAKGEVEIRGRDHSYYAFKYLKPKPVREFAKTVQFLQILKAENEGLLSYGLTLDPHRRFKAEKGGEGQTEEGEEEEKSWAAERSNVVETLVRGMQVHLCSDSVHEAAEGWNALRVRSLRHAVLRYLIPMSQKWLIDKLRVEAETYVSEQCGRELAAHIDVQPLRTSRMSVNDTPRVVVVVGGGFGIGRGAIRIVFIDDHGRYVEHRVADTLRGMANDMSGNNMRYDGSEDLRLILERRQPDVVAVAGMEPSTFRLLEDVKRITENHTALTSDEIHVTLAPDRLARLYYNSERAMQEFPHLSAAERYAMSVGRCLQDVLAEYVAADRELLGLLLHRSQRLVPVDRRWAFLERELIIAVNAAGVNINDIAQSPHKQKTLSYVCGLGPRKAQLILNALSGPAGTSLIESRSDLIYRELVTKNIFVNCASFLRVWPAQSDILDSTRIHPEDYDLARKMAADALDVEDDDDDDHNYSRNRRKYDDGPSRYVAEVMKRAPEKLDDLILSEYAMELEKRLSVSKLFCLRFIKRELQHPYADSRHIYRDPDPKDVFEMLSGESIGDTLREDGSTIVVAQVARIRDKFAIARLDSGIDGFLNVANIDDRRVDVVSDELSVGETITAVVKKIDFDKLTVDLSTKPSDLQAAKAVLDQPPQDFFDRYFDFEADSICRSKNNLEKQISQMMQRSIPHPLFKQFNSRQAEKFLQRRKVGECVIRPSSLGHSYLTITWKIAPGLYHHISVQESDKPNNNELALGRLLMVRNQKFSDLDELLGVYLDPLIRKFEEARRYPKFYNPDTDPSYRHQSFSHPEQPADPDPSDPNESAQAMQDRLARHAKRYVSRIERHLDNASRATGTGSYLLALDYENPGCLAIHFKPNPKAALVKKWVIKVRPNEFCLGDRGRYPNVGTLINGFKTIAANISSANQNSAPTRPFQQLSSHYNHPPPPPPPPSQHQQQHQQHHHNYHHQPPPPPPPHTAPYPSYYHHHQQ